ncbi:AI-2E family transporter [Zhihengliuella flava]|uniref:PurR-regulated permease PerM n=1 Tax=Zhihengliuella flava TaxID=1285193 RepID=A0A931DBF3_9MICC|nr:AI-2E family transporter [Zhihengliuella flava]MBG6084451.1 putative PurR-regulated permease PerM [Zhihengliuella flava]
MTGDSAASSPAAEGAAASGTPGAAVVPDAAEHTARTMWPRIALIAVTITGIALLMYFVQGARDIVAPIFLGLNLMIVAFPIQRALVARRVPRYLAAAATLIAVLALVILFFGSTGWAVGELLRELPEYNREFNELWVDISAGLSQLGISQTMILDQFRGVGAGSILSLLTPLITNVTAVLSVLATLVMAVFFLAMDSAGFPRRLDMVMRARPRMHTALTSFAQGVRRYWVVTTVFGLIVALLDVFALTLIDVPLVWVWGVLAFLTNYIPNIGFVIGLVPPALLALLDSGPGPAIAVLITYSLLNFTVQAIIQPKFTGQSVGVTPMISFLSLMFWYWVLGWLGALLALPATLLLKALLIDADPSARWINALISSNPDAEVPAHMLEKDPRPAAAGVPEGAVEAEPGDKGSAQGASAQQ